MDKHVKEVIDELEEILPTRNQAEADALRRQISRMKEAEGWRVTQVTRVKIKGIEAVIDEEPISHGLKLDLEALKDKILNAWLLDMRALDGDQFATQEEMERLLSYDRDSARELLG